MWSRVWPASRLAASLVPSEIDLQVKERVSMISSSGASDIGVPVGIKVLRKYSPCSDFNSRSDFKYNYSNISADI